MSEIAKRKKLSDYTLAERNALIAIDKAIEAINKLHPHPILTNAELILESAKESIYDYINAQG